MEAVSCIKEKIRDVFFLWETEWTGRKRVFADKYCVFTLCFRKKPSAVESGNNCIREILCRALLKLHKDNWKEKILCEKF